MASSSGDEDSFTGLGRVSILIEKFQKSPVTPITGSERSLRNNDNNGRVNSIVKMINSGNIKALEEERIEAGINEYVQCK